MMEHRGDEAPVEGSNGVSAESGIVCSRDGPRAVLALSGDLDLPGGDAAEAAVAALVADGVVDVSIRTEDVRFMDSSGLGGLLAARATLVDAGATFRFGPMSDAVARVVHLAGVRDLLRPTTN